MIEYDVTKDTFNQVWLSNVSLDFLINYTRKMALKHNYEQLWRFLNKIEQIDYKKPRKINKVSVDDLRRRLEFPCHFVECVNEREIRKPKHKLHNTYCLSCIETKFDGNLTPTILLKWKDKVDNKAKQLALELGRKREVATFDSVRLVCSTRKPKYRRYGWYGSYSGTDKKIKIFLRQFNTETEIVETYIHEVAHHFCNDSIHGKQFQEFMKMLLEGLNIVPDKYHTYKNGDINYRFIMDVKLPKR